MLAEALPRAALLNARVGLAAAVGAPSLLAGVDHARDEAYRHMVARGFRTEIAGVTMHRPNEFRCTSAVQPFNSPDRPLNFRCSAA
jgi:hypothetical protein